MLLFGSLVIGIYEHWLLPSSTNIWAYRCFVLLQLSGTNEAVLAVGSNAGDGDGFPKEFCEDFFPSCKVGLPIGRKGPGKWTSGCVQGAGKGLRGTGGVTW